MRNTECGITRNEHQQLTGSKLWPLAGLLVIITGLLLSGCSKPKAAPPRVVPVTAVAVDRKDVPLQIKAIGNVEAYNTVAVKSQVNGEISEVFFREGQDVRTGEQLFQIDRRPFEAALRQAESALARDRAQATNAGVDAERYATLAAKGFVSRQEFDSVRTNSEALQAVVQADEAAVENARLQLGYTLIKSPIDGKTGSIQIKKGNVVKANDLPLVTINQLMPINISFAVPEQDLAQIKRYRATGELHVDVNMPQSTTKSVHGTLTFVDNAVNTTTGTILLKATSPNQDHALWPGQFVEVVLTLTTEKNRVLVPSEAIQTGQQGQYVYVINGDMASELRVVKPGRVYDKWTLIDAGVAPGETVVTDGQLRLVPGAKVEIKGAKQEEAKSDAKAETKDPKK